MLRTLVAPSLISFLVWGCVPEALLGAQQSSQDTDEDAEDPDDAPDDSPSLEEVEGTCTSWKYAYCDAIEACSAFVSREQCELDLGWLDCKPDADLESCERRIQEALSDDACEDLPDDCGPGTIADRSRPTALCEDIHHEMCEFRFFCGMEVSTEACLDTLSKTEPCAKFTSFLPTAFDCADAYSTLGCDEGMPAACVGALRY